MRAAECPAESVQAALRAELAALDELLDALQAENQALRGHDGAALEAAVARKSVATTCLAEHAGRRTALLQAAGCSADAAGLRHLAASLDARTGEDLRVLATALGDRIARVTQQNHVNGRVIDAGQHALQALLDVLRGESGTDQVYGPDGSTGAGRSSRPLARV